MMRKYILGGDKMIDFNRVPYLGTEVEYMRRAIANAKLCGDGPFTKNAHS